LKHRQCGVLCFSLCNLRIYSRVCTSGLLPFQATDAQSLHFRDTWNKLKQIRDTVLERIKATAEAEWLTVGYLDLRTCRVGSLEGTDLTV
jgi:hypothetical protein